MNKLHFEDLLENLDLKRGDSFKTQNGTVEEQKDDNVFEEGTNTEENPPEESKEMIEFRKLLMSDSTEEDEPVATKNDFDDLDEIYSQLVESNEFVSAVAGTSRKSSNSFTDLKQFLKIHSTIMSEEDPDEKSERRKNPN